MTSGGNNFTDFPEIVPTREITAKTEKTFLVFSSVHGRGPILAYFLNRLNALASIAPTLIRHCPLLFLLYCICVDKWNIHSCSFSVECGLNSVLLLYSPGVTTFQRTCRAFTRAITTTSGAWWPPRPTVPSLDRKQVGGKTEKGSDSRNWQKNGQYKRSARPSCSIQTFFENLLLCPVFY